MFLICSACRCFLVGPFFSCLLCLEKGNDTFDLCCACYRGGRVAHEHYKENSVDQYSLIRLLISRATAGAQKSPGTRADANAQKSQGVRADSDADAQKCDGIKKGMEELPPHARLQWPNIEQGLQKFRH